MLMNCKDPSFRSYTEKAQTFADHLTTVFQPHPSENPPEEKEALTLQLEIPYQLERPLSRFHHHHHGQNPSGITSRLQLKKRRKKKKKIYSMLPC
jgi:hypothetical protein